MDDLTLVDVLATGAPGGGVPTGVGLAELSGLVLGLQVGHLDEVSVGGLEGGGVLGLDGGKDLALDLLLLGQGGAVGHALVGAGDEQVECGDNLLVVQGGEVALLDGGGEVGDLGAITGSGTVDGGCGHGTISHGGGQGGKGDTEASNGTSNLVHLHAEGGSNGQDGEDNNEAEHFI